MVKASIFQIVYSDDTAAGRDPGFLMLDNREGGRPDWYEYWPMRRFLTNASLDDDRYYGFVSPRFGQKTGLTSDDVHRVLDGRSDDVVIFSPYFDLGALFFNQLDQGESVHPGIKPLFAALLPLGAPGSLLLEDSTNTVFCNFFAARPRFWAAWLARCEAIFAQAETGTGEIADRLRAPSDYEDGKTAQYKVFLIERMASALLALDRRWRAVAPLAGKLPLAIPALAASRDRLVELDRLKYDAARARDPRSLLQRYVAKREAMVGALNGKAAPATAL